MTRTRLGLLGLCAMVFGLMAFSTTAAHAEVGAKWLLAEKAPGTALIPFNPETLKVGIGLERDAPKGEEYPYVLHTEILKIKVLFLCKDLKVAGSPVLTTNGGISSGKVLFSGCLTDLNGVKNSNCTPKDAEEATEGTILTKPLHALLELHKLATSTDDILKLLPDEVGGPFAVIEMGEACAIGKKVPVIGKLALEDCEGLALTHLVKHLVQPFTALTSLFTISETAEHAATLLGSAFGFLTGEHVGLKFSGDPA
jgi:hypothetical protein